MQKLPVIESESALRELLFERVQAFDRIVPLSRPEPAHKWRLTSAMQKSIRRGHTEAALVAADSLLQVDVTYLWPRLKVVALEDVGLADPVACALVLQAVRDSNFRRKLGERRCLAALVFGLATAAKDRSLTHLLLLNHNRPPPPPLWNQYIESLNLPWLVAYLAKRGRSAEKLGVQIPLLWKRMPAKTELFDVPPDPHGDEVIAGMIAATFDMHTTEGKRSLAYFRKACPAARRFYERNDIDPGRSLGITLFYVEGRHLNKKLDWAGRAELCAESRIRTSMNYGFETEAQIEEVMQIVRDHRELLNECRRRVL